MREFAYLLLANIVGVFAFPARFLSDQAQNYKRIMPKNYALPVRRQDSQPYRAGILLQDLPGSNPSLMNHVNEYLAGLDVKQSAADPQVLMRPGNLMATCTQPSVRKEWRNLTSEQKEGWTGAVKCLAKLPSSGRLTPTLNATDPGNTNPPVNESGSWYDDLTYVHMDLNTRIHQTGFFFPWHRFFVWSFDQSLRELCGYTGPTPYWNWSMDATDFEHAPILADSDPRSGLGGFGDPAQDGVVIDGAFAGLTLAYPSPHVLRRKYEPYPYRNLPPPFYTKPNLLAASTFTAPEVNKMIGGFKGDFGAFQTAFEALEGPHMSVHLIMGGDIGGSCPRSTEHCISDAQWSPNEPMFWLHHTMVDKVWYDWQHAYPDNFFSFKAGTVRDWITWPEYPTGAPPVMKTGQSLPTDGILLGNYTVGDMFNTTSNGPLCYVYG